MMRFLFLLFLLGGGVLGVTRPAPAAEPLTAVPRSVVVIDGDTIQLGNHVLHLAGIDAPELGQPCRHNGNQLACGLEGAYRLRKLIGLATMRTIRCFPEGTEGAVTLATCMIGDQDISMIILQSGYALAVPGAPPIYAAAEHQARTASYGIWGGAFVLPWEWRSGTSLPKAPEDDSTGRTRKGPPAEWDEHTFLNVHRGFHSFCLIKAVIGDDRSRHYLGPLDEDYWDYTVRPAKGERYFCSDDEARQAGWRRKGELAPGR